MVTLQAVLQVFPPKKLLPGLPELHLIPKRNEEASSSEVESAADDSAEESLNAHLDRGFYKNVLALGMAAGIDRDELAKKLGKSIKDLDHLKQRYNAEIAEIEMHKKVVDDVFHNLTSVRLAKIQHQILDQIASRLEDGSYEAKDLAPLLRTVVTAFPAHLTAKPPGHGPTPPAQRGDLKGRVEALLDE